MVEEQGADTNKCFLLSCYALKVEADYTELSTPQPISTGGESYEMRSHVSEGAVPTHHVSHIGGLAIARSVEEASSLAKERILNLWPESEGWTVHSIHLKEITDSHLEEALEILRVGNSSRLIT